MSCTAVRKNLTWVSTDCCVNLLLIIMIIIIVVNIIIVGWDSSVGTATRCGLDGPGFEFRLGARFCIPVQTAPGAHSAAYTMGSESFPAVQRLGRDVNSPPYLAPRYKKGSALLLHSVSASMARSRVNFTVS